MQLVEQHVIRKTDSRYQAIDAAAFASKNLYNLANYHMRQNFIHTGTYLGYAAVYHLVKGSDAYTALPRKVSNDVLRLLDKNWKAWRLSLAAWHEDPSQFSGRPCLPKYKDKQKGRNILIYDIQARSRERTQARRDPALRARRHRHSYQTDARASSAHCPTRRLLCGGSGLRAQRNPGSSRSCSRCRVRYWREQAFRL